MRIRKMLAAASALLLALAAPSSGGSAYKTTTLAANFDLDGAAASATAIHSADTITDSASFTIDAQPDSPRLLNATLTDADGSITACVLTVVGTKADGTAATATTNLTGGSGAKTLSPVVYFKTVTSSSVGVCTGEGVGDTVSLGTSGNPVPIYLLPYGHRPLNSQASRRFALEWAQVNKLVDDNSADLEAVTAGQEPFKQVAVGDLILINVDGELYERVVTVKTSDDDITLDTAVVIPSGGLTFKYRKLFYGPDTEDSVLPVGGYEAGSFVFLFHQLGDDAKIRVQCRVSGAGTGWVLVDNTAQSATATLVGVVKSVDFRLTGYDECRAGLEFATNDGGGDTGGELEIITVQFTGTLR